MFDISTNQNSEVVGGHYVAHISVTSLEKFIYPKLECGNIQEKNNKNFIHIDLSFRFYLP